MNTTDSDYALEPTAFRSMGGAQQLTDALEEIIHDHRMGAANVRPELVEIFSEIVNNAAGHGMSDKGAHAHVRFMPHRRVMAFDAVIVDSDPGIRGTLARNPALPEIETDADAIGLAVQELISGTGIPTRGIGLWMTLTEMRKTCSSTPAAACSPCTAPPRLSCGGQRTGSEPWRESPSRLDQSGTIDMRHRVPKETTSAS